MSILPLLHHRLRAEFVVETDLNLPEFKGIIWNRVFNQNLKQVICPFHHKRCQDCFLLSRCDYPKLLNNNTNPVLIKPPLIKDKKLERGKLFSADFILLPAAFKSLAYLLLALQRMGKIGIGENFQELGQFNLRHLSYWKNGNWQLLFTDEQGLFDHLPEAFLPQLPSSPITQLTIHLVTPLRLKHQGNVYQFSFNEFIHAIEQRIFNIKMVFPLPSKSRINTTVEELRWQKFSYYSSYQGCEISQGGLMGTVTWQGDLTPYLPWLQAGELLQIGHLIKFGLGWFELEF
ncbi:CRISPR system precrRNA processing endoribonuclease RAMP protein Cas6 [Thioflexithrix psekupsensis]|nr:CRISPR system precrRNA processing endoribonuclease RAMP protein Cas6 [Thioflexithrix psekupsensis]